MTTNDIIDHHLQSFARSDLEGILSDYAPDAILFTPERTLRGRDAIRELFVAMLSEFSTPGARFELGTRSVVGDCGYIVWSGETDEQRYELVTDTFLVRDGCIVMQSFAAWTTPRSAGDARSPAYRTAEAPAGGVTART